MFKAIIWSITIAGLLPVILLAFANLSSILIAAGLASEPNKPDAFTFVGDISVGIGSSKPLHLSTSVWPAIVVLLGVLGVVVGLWTLVPPQPTRIATGGFSKVESHVEALLRSPNRNASLIISTADGQNSILLMREEGQTRLDISVDRMKNDGEVLRTYQFFKDKGVLLIQEHLSANGGVEDATHHFEYQVAGDASAISQLCVSIFTELFGVDDKHGIEFRD